MGGGDSDGSPGPESNSSADESDQMIVSQGNSENEDVLGHKNHNPKSDTAPYNFELSGEEEAIVRSNRRIQLMSDSDGESANQNAVIKQYHGKLPSDTESRSSISSSQDSRNKRLKSSLLKSRIRKISSSDDDSEKESKSNNPCSQNMVNNRYKSTLQKSPKHKRFSSEMDSDPDIHNKASSDNEVEEESRIKNKRNKLKQKFQNMHSKKNKKAAITEYDQDNVLHEDRSSGDEASVEKIKQIIKQGTVKLDTLSTLYDPDTSDEENSAPSKNNSVPKKARKSTILTSPKHQRMSAKQAMENMQKIKSESNRMLREKEVSLPYHRPKALTLKDIMSRQRAAVTPDGKALPIKMNNEQLKHYVDILEQRQKEVIELCKSDTEEEVENTDIHEEKLPAISSLDNISRDDNMSAPEIQTKINADEDLVNSDKALPEKCTANEVINTENLSSDENPSIDNTNAIQDVSFKEVEKELNIHEIIPKTNDLEPMIGDIHMDDSISDNQKSKSMDENNSMEISLVYNDSVEEVNHIDTDKVEDAAGVNESLPKDNVIDTENKIIEGEDNVNENFCREKPASGVESQFISLHYDTEKSDINIDNVNDVKNNVLEKISEQQTKESHNISEPELGTEEIDNNVFSDDEMNMDDIDALIENAEIALSQTNCLNVNSPMLIKEPMPLTGTPKLTGAPGMVIDLDGTDPTVPKKLSGVELLKERFVYFNKLKTPEEQERERERRIKPGMQHLKLKLELEEQIAEQRSLEWARRLKEEKTHQKELSALRGEGSDAEDDIDTIEAKLEEKEEKTKKQDVDKESSSESEEEEEVLEEELVDKPRKRNPMVDDEAEESDCDNESESEKHHLEENNDNDDDADNEADDSEEESSEESEEEEEEAKDDQQNKPKKGRILKAFEDSDDEEAIKKVDDVPVNINGGMQKTKNNSDADKQVIKPTQDDELHLAQKSVSEDLFTSQGSSVVNSDISKLTNNAIDKSFEDKPLGTQTFSILETTTENTHTDFPLPDTLSVPPDTQAYNDNDENLDAVVGMCSGSFSQTQNLVPQSQISAEGSASLAIGEDVLALCTGQLSQEGSQNKETSLKEKTTDQIDVDVEETVKDVIEDTANKKTQNNVEPVRTGISKEGESIGVRKTAEDPNLKSILDELNDPEFDSPTVIKYFASNDSQGKENKQSIANAQFKKKFVIDSDEEDKEQETNAKKKKKIKRKKLEQRALQISDDEDEAEDEEEEYESELEEDEGQRIVEYDSEENEVIVEHQQPKKKRRLGDFFEQEAELTSEDEWVGSGDEDEAGLDRMEREAGDDDTFNEKQLQRELGQIHMRDVLDQDKREVRIIQELLFEDGDLGGGSRQRKFRWRNADGEEETGTLNDELADTQEEEFESEEQWRKQRHEREMFLKTLKEQEEPDHLDITMTRTSIIKANLSKTSSNVFVDVDTSIEDIQPPALDKKTVSAKDIPSPKKPFSMFSQNYHGSLLTRGRGALARLAALATPLANDDDTYKVANLKPTNKRNFVFASIDAPAPEDDEPKVNKRKAEGNVGTPRLVKKLRTEDKQKLSKSSLLDHINI
ncbi:hypothetical protein O0L34_g1643 [Tuta absoluta]|nr:hypothetical protein O0L34_g1643 [Tuta absoluta]